jgi:16S rRNA processing protein RimM
VTGWRPTSTSSTTDDAGRDDGPDRSDGELLDVGRIDRPHGLRGEMVVHFVSNRAERSAPGSAFVTDRGELRIERSRPFGRRWLVTFSGVDDFAEAERLRGTVLRGLPLEDPSALWVHELVGAAVIDHSDGRRLGEVRAVVANPASDLLELDDGGLVPARFIVSHAPGRVVVDIPSGLLD